MKKANESIFRIPNMFDPKRKAIVDSLTKLGIMPGSYEITKDYVVNINSNVAITNKLAHGSPVTFGRVTGNFIWSFGNLRSLRNMPTEVNGNFIISNNRLTSLKGAPDRVNGIFDCSNNPLTSLEDGPRSVRTYICNNCNLNSLDCNNLNTLEFQCANNNLTTLKGAPKMIDGYFNCGFNKLKNLDFLPVCKKVNYENNPIEKLDKSYVPPQSGNIQKNDTVIYDKPGSKYDKLEGEIADISSMEDGTSKNKYKIRFNKIRNPNLDRAYTIIDIPIENFKLKNADEKPSNVSQSPLAEGDYVKFKEYGGVIKSIDECGVCLVKFGKSFNYVYYKYLSRIVDFEKTQKEKEEEEFRTGDKIILLDPEGKYDECKGVVTKVRSDYGKMKADIVIKDKSNMSVGIPSVPFVKLERDTSDTSDNIVYTEEFPEMNPEDKFKPGDKVVFDCGDEQKLSKYNKSEGTVTSRARGNLDNKDQYYHISIKDSTGSLVYLQNIPTQDLKLINDEPKRITREEIPYPKEFNKNDKIIYTGDRSDYMGVNVSGCKGIIDWVRGQVIDLKLVNKNGGESKLYNVDRSHIKLVRFYDKFKRGDKIIYKNECDNLLNKKIGVITKVHKGNEKYNVTFNTSEYIVTVLDVDPYGLEKYIPTNIDFTIDDNIIYTKPDSLNYGCKGTITGYDMDTDMYELQITNRYNKKFKIKKTKVENIEKAPPKVSFKNGDKIRYINSISPYTGLIGKVNSKLSDGKYSITLKNGVTSTISITTDPDNIVLLEESEDVGDFVYGQNVIYKKEGSKYFNRIGEFKGARASDGKYEINFDKDGSFVRVYLDDEEIKFLEPSGPPPKTTITTTTTYTINRKKKKKNKPKPRPPVLVYNRRHVARVEGNRPDKSIEN